ncbi:tetratricopeptide repeat protein [Bryobacter aggregatus]|uniref:tetratricopeptide repeat protein n=1 Tax=Bryobacter aggregatus TaxID=360054 RepID=UPI0004E13173|nr:tetratricopeptide repeat protein [Bryobacter aggregatus]
MEPKQVQTVMNTTKIAAILLIALAFVGCDNDPKAARQKYLETGNRYFKNAKYREAVIFYRRALQKDARFADAYCALGNAELKSGKPIEAMRALQRCVELDKNNTEAASKLAEIYLAAYARSETKPKNLLKEIEDISKRLLDRDPKNYDGLRLQGFLRLANGDTKGSIESMLAAEKIKPYQKELSTVLFQVLLQDGRTDEAYTYINKAIDADKENGPNYDILYSEYAKKDMIPQAEAVLQRKVAALSPKQPAVRMQLAAHYYAAKQFDKMQQILDQVIAEGKTNKLLEQPRMQVGDFYFKIRDFEHALQQFEQGATEQAAKKHDYQKRIVETYVFMNKKTDAVRLVEQILKEDPKDNDATAMRASLLLQSGSKEQVDTAVSDLQSAVSRTPQNHVMRLNLAKAFLARGDADQAKVQLTEALKIRPDFQIAKIALSQIFLQKQEFGKAIEFANQVLSYDPNDVRGRLLRATALYGSKDLAGAKKDLDVILARYPNLNDALYMQARLQLDLGEKAQAQTTFEKMMKVNPSDPRGLLGVVETYLQLGKGDLAVKTIEAELVKAPERNDIRNALANTAVRVGNYERALPEFQKLLAANPKDASVVLRLAEVYKRMGDDANAVKYFKQAGTLLPNDPIAPLQLAMIYDRQGKPVDSKPIYEQIVKLDPGNVLALNNLAMILAEQGTELDMALTYAERAKQKLPSNIDVADTLGLIYIKKNLSDQAISVFTDIVKKDPNRAVFHYHLAMAYYQKGDKPNAKKAAQTALSKLPPKGEEVKIRELLAKCG